MSNNKPFPFENEIFDHYRQNANKINNAIKFIVSHNYTVIDLEGFIITKDNIDKDKKETVPPEPRYNTRNRE